MWPGSAALPLSYEHLYHIPTGPNLNLFMRKAWQINVLYEKGENP